MSAAAWLGLLCVALFGAWLWQWQRSILLSREKWRAVSDARALAAQLDHRNSRLDALFATVNEAILRLNKAGDVLALNVQARKLFHLPRSFDLPQPMTALYRRPGWNAAVRRALAQMPEPVEIPDIHLDNYVLAVRLAPLGDDEALLLCLDVTRQRELEAERDRLLRDLMHDLKTPLTSILGYARSIEKFSANEAVCRESAQTIVQEAGRLNRLIESMLTLDQSEGRKIAEEAVCNAVDVAGQLQQLMAPMAEGKGVDFQVSVDGECGNFPMNDGDLYRLMTNLVENAIRFTPDGGHVSLDLRRVEDEFRLCVSDDGPGIDPGHLPHVTERFYRADDSRNAESGGHGLGLAIVQEIVNRYGGNLVLANRPEGGLKACVYVKPSESG